MYEERARVSADRCDEGHNTTDANKEEDRDYKEYPDGICENISTVSQNTITWLTHKR